MLLCFTHILLSYLSNYWLRKFCTIARRDVILVNGRWFTVFDDNDFFFIRRKWLHSSTLPRVAESLLSVYINRCLVYCFIHISIVIVMLRLFSENICLIPTLGRMCLLHMKLDDGYWQETLSWSDPSYCMRKLRSAASAVSGGCFCNSIPGVFVWKLQSFCIMGSTSRT